MTYEEPLGTRLRLAVEFQSGASTDYLFDQAAISIGRALTNDVVVTDDSDISGHHCLLIEHTNGAMVLTDDESHNGTWIGPVRVREAPVLPGMTFRCGKTQFRIERLTPDVHLEATGLAGLVGRSPAMQALYATLRKVAPLPSTVVIEGETGVGKELVARALHTLSGRTGEFVVLDCGAASSALLGDIMGHVKGAYSGAVGRRGLVEQADGGTLFVDEIGELPTELQPQLLRVISARQVRPIGASHPRDVDFRLVAATHRDLEKAVRERAFRSDLYHRLHVVTVQVPPLRERLSDVPLLVTHFLGQQTHRQVPQFAPSSLRLMRRHAWRGNVRALRNEVERACIQAHSNLIQPHELSETLSGTARRPRTHPDKSTVGDSVSTSNSVETLEFTEARKAATEAFIELYVKHRHEEHDGNITDAAAASGVSRQHFHTLVKKHLDDSEP